MGVERVVLKGERFGYLRVIKETRPTIQPCGRKRRRFLFKCDCGNKTTVALSGVVTGNTMSCGCYGTKRRREAQLTHGLSTKIDRKLYQVWLDIHSRCYNENTKCYDSYGGRGIKIAKSWHRDNAQGLSNFVKWSKENGYKHGLQLDRRNNDRSYTPNNCRYTTTKINSRNKRVTIMIEHPKTGKQIPLVDFYDEKPRKISYNTFEQRYRRGWSVTESLAPL